MNKFYTFFLSLISTATLFSQQIDNASMEEWDNLGASTEEPTNWNSFMTASGGLAFFGSQQVEQSSDVPSSSSGMYSVRVYSTSILGIVANGNLTLGQINMGSSTPSSTDNYNFTNTADSDFSQILTTMPDSIVFWVQFNASNNADSARIHAIIHDEYDFRDPIDAASAPYTVATAGLNYGTTNGWERKSLPFDYVGPSTTAKFILITFTTNKIPGGGSAGDEVFIDDVELIYNSASGIQGNEIDRWIGYNSSAGLHFSNEFDADEYLIVYDLMGNEISKGSPESLKGLILNPGMFIISHKTGSSKIISY
jgi:hypothetical protein